MQRRAVLHLTAAALALLAVAFVAGCGSSGNGAASGEAEGAQLVPADTAAFISVRAVPGSSQWQSAQALLDRFPSGATALQSIIDRIAPGGSTADVEAIFGDEVDVAVLDLSSKNDPPAVLLNRPDDPAGLEKLLAAADPRPVWRVQDGWYLIADSRATLDRAVSGADKATLAGSDDYRAALGDLPADGIVSLYVSGKALVAAGAHEGTSILGALGESADLSSVGAVALAEPQGLRVEGSLVAPSAPETAPFETTLASLVPADAIAFVSFGDPKAIVERVLEQVGASDASAPVKLALTVAQELLPVFEGENALFVRSGKPDPEMTLLLSPSDPSAAVSTLDTLAGLAKIAALAGQGTNIASSPVDIDGIAATKLELKDRGVTLYYAAVADHLAVSTATTGIASLVATTPRLADDLRFVEATTAAGLPRETTGFAYLDLHDGVTAAEDLGRFTGVDPEVVENLRPLQYLVVSGGMASGARTFSGFLGIR